MITMDISVVVAAAAAAGRIVGDDDGGQLMSPEEYEAYKRKVIPMVSFTDYLNTSVLKYLFVIVMEVVEDIVC